MEKPDYTKGTSDSSRLHELLDSLPVLSPRPMTKMEMLRWLCAEAQREYIDAGARSLPRHMLRERRLALHESELVLESAIAAERDAK